MIDSDHEDEFDEMPLEVLDAIAEISTEDETTKTLMACIEKLARVALDLQDSVLSLEALLIARLPPDSHEHSG